MPWRIRAYLAVLTFRYFGMAVVLHRSGQELASVAHLHYVFEYAAPSTWAWIFAAVGTVAFGAVVRPRALGIRVTLVASVALTTLWAAAFAAAEIVDNQRAALGTIFFVSLAAKDLIVSSMPFVSPLDARKGPRMEGI